MDIQPSRTYFVSLFQNLGLTPNIVLGSPSIEMVRGMVAQGFGFSLLVTRPVIDHSYDGKRIVCRDITEPVEHSGLVCAKLKQTQLTTNLPNSFWIVAAIGSPGWMQAGD